MDAYTIAALVLVVMILGYILFLKPYLQKKGMLTEAQLGFIDKVCDEAVDYAKEVFAKDPTVDLKKLALDKAFELIAAANIIPEEFLTPIHNFVESEIFKIFSGVHNTSALPAKYQVVVNRIRKTGLYKL